MHILPPQKMNLNTFKNEKLDNLNSENIEYSNFEDEELSSIELNNLDFECCKFKNIVLPNASLEKVTFQDVTIKGNVKIYGTNITVSKNTVIEGNLSYPEDAVYKAEDGATIGNIIKTEPIQNEDDENFFATVSAKIWSFLSLIVVFAVISLLFPKVFNKINDKFEKMELGEVIEVFTKGLVAIILIPVIVVLLCCLMIGIPLGIIMILLYGIAIYLTTIFTAYLLGYKIWQKVFNKDINMLALGLIGLFILFILSLIPGVRTLVSILTTLIGLGLIVDIIKQKKE